MAKAVFLLRSTLLLPILCYCPYCVTIAIVATSLYYAKINTLRKTFHLNENQTPQFEIRYSTQIKHIYAYAVHKSNRIAKNKCKHKAFSSPLSNNIHSKRKLRLFFLFRPSHKISGVRHYSRCFSIMQNQINPMPSN